MKSKSKRKNYIIDIIAHMYQKPTNSMTYSNKVKKHIIKRVIIILPIIRYIVIHKRQNKI